MRTFVWSTAVAGAASAKVIQVAPERFEGARVDLLADIQYATLAEWGFVRDELFLDLLRPVSDEPTPVIVFVLGSG